MRKKRSKFSRRGPSQSRGLREVEPPRQIIQVHKCAGRRLTAQEEKDLPAMLEKGTAPDCVRARVALTRVRKKDGSTGIIPVMRRKCAWVNYKQNPVGHFKRGRGK